MQNENNVNNNVSQPVVAPTNPLPPVMPATTTIPPIEPAKPVENKDITIIPDPLAEKKEKAPKQKVIRYTYKAISPEGKKLNGTMDTFSEAEVRAFLTNQGLQIVEIKEDKLSTSLGLASINHGKMKFKTLIFFLTQLSTYIKSGIPLTDSIVILSNQTKDKADKLLYERIIYELNKGVSFSECLQKQGNVFPRLLINMIKTAELTGNLTEILDDMTAYYEQKESNRKQIISAMTYPSVLFIVTIAILTFIILYVIPQFVGIYGQLGTALPGITVFLINLSNYMTNNYLTVIAIIVFVVVVFTLCFKNIRQFRYGVQWLLMHIPVVKNIIIYNEIVMFTSTFATLIKHDVFITDSMAILRTITNNEIYKVIINDAINNLSTGNGVSPAFKGNWAFPSTAYEMLVTGEKTGKMGTMMDSVAKYYSSAQAALVVQLKALIEPVMIIFLAGMVGVILMAVIVPMFSMYSGVVG